MVQGQRSATPSRCCQHAKVDISKLFLLGCCGFAGWGVQAHLCSVPSSSSPHGTGLGETQDMGHCSAQMQTSSHAGDEFEDEPWPPGRWRRPRHPVMMPRAVLLPQMPYSALGCWGLHVSSIETWHYCHCTRQSELLWSSDGTCSPHSAHASSCISVFCSHSNAARPGSMSKETGIGFQEVAARLLTSTLHATRADHPCRPGMAGFIKCILQARASLGRWAKGG